jgi:hypothetical protein
VFPCAPSAGNRIYATYHAGGGIGLRWSDDYGASWPDLNKSAVADVNEMPAFDDPTCAADGQDVWVAYGLSPDPFSTGNNAKLSSVRLAHSPDGGKTVDFRVDAGDAQAAPFYMHPFLVRETGGALDLAYYAGASDGDPSGSLRRSRSTDGGKTFSASALVKSPIVFTGDRASVQWLGDYFGLATAGGELFLSYADNRIGGNTAVVHIGFYRTAVP